MPTISVIVPVYNVEKYIHRCVDSILAQTFTDFELILVDDGSPDNCPAICDEYAAKDSRVRVIHQKNQGQAAARNYGVSMAKGAWISFVDSDDMIASKMLELLYQVVQESGVRIASVGSLEGYVPKESACQMHAYVAAVKNIDEQALIEITKEWGYCYWVVWGKLIDRKIVEKYPMQDGRIYEDNATVCRWLFEAKKVAYIPEEYYYYQVNLEGTTKQTFSLKHLDLLWALREQIDFYDSIGYFRMKRNLCAQYLETAAWYSGRIRNELNNYKRAAEIRKDMRKMLRDNPLDTLPLQEKQKAYIRKSFHPAREQLKQLPQNVAHILRDGGIHELIRRILRKFKQY